MHSIALPISSLRVDWHLYRELLEGLCTVSGSAERIVIYLIQ